MEFFDIIWALLIFGGAIKGIAKYIEKNVDKDSTIAKVATALLQGEEDREQINKKYSNELSVNGKEDNEILEARINEDTIKSKAAAEELSVNSRKKDKKNEKNFFIKGRQKDEKMNDRKPVNDLIANINESDLLRGVIFKEILDEPRAKRPHRSIDSK